MADPRSPEQTRLAAGLRAWQWGTGIQLAFASAFALTHLAFLIAFNASWLTPQSHPSWIRVLSVLGLMHNLALVGVWGFKAYAGARLIRPIGEHSLNMSTLIGRLLMVVGSAPLLYCAMFNALQILTAKPGMPPAAGWTSTLPTPLNALFLIGAACFAAILAKRAGHLRLALLLAALFLAGILPDALNLLALHIKLALKPGETLPLAYRLIATLSPLLLALTLACEFYAVRRLRTLY